ncbi:MAG: hypothetical protein EPO06_06875 [Burkholderiaceae bacterium]|nr:MAG: hypothetical protein EPO06_06875 [Burkholderiaceae bacterium]
MSKGMTIYLWAVSIIAIVIGSLPLAVAMWIHEWPVVGKLFLHAPGQFLFLAAFFPAAAALMPVAGKAALQCIATNPAAKADPLFQRGASWFPGIALFLFIVSSAFALMDYMGAAIELHDLSPQYAKRAVNYNSRLLQLLSNGGASAELNDLKELPVCRGFFDETGQIKADSATKTLKECAGVIFRDLNQKKATDPAIQEIFNRDSTSMADALQFMQIALNPKMLQQLDASGMLQPGAIVKPMRWAILAQLALTIFLALHYVLWVMTLAGLRIRGLWNAAVGESAKNVLSPLATGLAIFSVWVALRIYTVAEINLIRGEPFPDIGAQWPVAVALVVMLLYLAYAFAEGGALKLLLDYWPILGAMATGIAAMSNPIATSQYIGTNATAAKVAVYLISYALLFTLWIGFALLKKPAPPAAANLPLKVPGVIDT